MDYVQILDQIVELESKNPKSNYANFEALARVFVQWCRSRYPEFLPDSSDRNRVLFVAIRIVNLIFRKDT